MICYALMTLGYSNKKYRLFQIFITYIIEVYNIFYLISTLSYILKKYVQVKKLREKVEYT